MRKACFEADRGEGRGIDSLAGNETVLVGGCVGGVAGFGISVPEGNGPFTQSPLVWREGMNGVLSWPS